jgi:hypothetical protein
VILSFYPNVLVGVGFYLPSGVAPRCKTEACVIIRMDSASEVDTEFTGDSGPHILTPSVIIAIRALDGSSSFSLEAQMIERQLVQIISGRKSQVEGLGQPKRDVLWV